MDIKDKVIVITGGGRGLGRAMALELAGKGARLALVDMNGDDLDTTAGLCMEKGAEARCYICNVTEEIAVEQLFADIATDFGAINGLVNNAGVTRDALLVKAKDGQVVSKMTLENWNLVMNVNLTGTFLCAREAACKMIELGNPGCIINISSISRSGNMGQTNYTATKAGAEAMAVTWAKELARYGIRAASIAPGFIATDMVMAMKPEALEKMAAGIPAKRLGQPEEIARTVSFILENDYISGRCIEVDGALRI
ncbi:SDR family oxidoreductase [Marinobacterium rhizophilum]|uniref:SDR family oxidoreductase n=1 Tax=Marinobacterium rhizophilum TaxID=420402 RepID=UPI000379B884|nr:SDR family oxidoreductase [Marinobacterium rhizophilum]